MSDAKFSKLLDYETLKQQFGDTEDQAQPAKSAIQDAPEFDPYIITKRPGGRCVLTFKDDASNKIMHLKSQVLPCYRLLQQPLL